VKERKTCARDRPCQSFPPWRARSSYNLIDLGGRQSL